MDKISEMNPEIQKRRDENYAEVERIVKEGQRVCAEIRARNRARRPEWERINKEITQRVAEINEEISIWREEMRLRHPEVEFRRSVEG